MKPTHSALRFRLLFRLLSLILGVALVAGSQFGAAEIYKTVDKSGKVTFTDQPAPDAEPVEVKEPNTADPVKISEPQAPEANKPISYTVSITSPKDKQLFPNRLQPFTVSTSVTPQLPKGFRLRLLVDGKPYSISIDNFQVSDLDPGKHTLQVNLINLEDSTIAHSDSITIYTRSPGAR